MIGVRPAEAPRSPRAYFAELSGARAIVYAAAVGWDATPGSDRRLVEQLAKRIPIVWVDPPVSLLRALSQARVNGRADRSRIDRAAPNVVRVHTVGPPGISRPLVRELARIVVGWRLRRLIGRHQIQVAALIGLVGQVPLPTSVDAVKIYYATDNFVAGASLMGRSERAVARAEARSLRVADIVLAVSPPLVDKLRPFARRVVLFPNGCNPEHFAPIAGRPIPADVPPMRPLAGYVGHIADRLDTALLFAVVERGVDLLVIGPRDDVHPDLRAPLDRLLAHPRVHWIGPKAYDQLPAYLAAMDVGLTPYGDTEFNRSSFPLKTLEYLSAGVAVVSTNLPAVQWLQTSLIDIADTPQEFADRVQDLLRSDRTGDAARRREFARKHSWSARADTVLELIDEHPGPDDLQHVPNRRR